LQCVAVCCSVLQCVAVCCSVLQCVEVCYSRILGHKLIISCSHGTQGSVRCSVLQSIAVYCCVLQCVAAEYDVIIRCRHGTPGSVCCVCHSVLQGVEVCCRELQCVAVHCSVSESHMDVWWTRYFSTHESRQTNKRVIPHCVCMYCSHHIWISHVTHMNESYHTYSLSLPPIRHVIWIKFSLKNGEDACDSWSL